MIILYTHVAWLVSRWYLSIGLGLVAGREKERPTMARRSISEEFVKRRKKREVDMKRETDRFHLRGDGRRTDGCSFVFPPSIWWFCAQTTSPSPTFTTGFKRSKEMGREFCKFKTGLKKVKQFYSARADNPGIMTFFSWRSMPIVWRLLACLSQDLIDDLTCPFVTLSS